MWYCICFVFGGIIGYAICGLLSANGKDDE